MSKDENSNGSEINWVCGGIRVPFLHGNETDDELAYWASMVDETSVFNTSVAQPTSSKRIASKPTGQK